MPDSRTDPATGEQIGGDIVNWHTPSGAPLAPPPPDEPGLQTEATPINEAVNAVANKVSSITGTTLQFVKKWLLIAVVFIAAAVVVFFAARAFGQRIGG